MIGFHLGLGARLVFIHPQRVKWAEPVAYDWIIADTSDPEACYQVSLTSSNPFTKSQFNFHLLYHLGTRSSCLQYTLTSLFRDAYPHMPPLFPLLSSPHHSLSTSLLHFHTSTFVSQAVQSWLSDQRSRPDSLFPGSFSAVISFDEFSISSAAVIAERFGLPTTPSSVINEVRNKLKLRTLCQQANIPSPAAIAVSLADVINRNLHGRVEGYEKLTPQATEASNSTEVSSSSSTSSSTRQPPSSFSSSTPSSVNLSPPDTPRPLQFPLVVKPLSGAGSNFVRRVRNIGELEEVAKLFVEQTDEVKALVAADEAKSSSSMSSSTTTPSLSTTTSPSPSVPSGVSILQAKWRHWGLSLPDTAFMLEELMVGHEVDIDMLVQKGEIKFLSVSDNFPSAGANNYFMESGGMCPSALPVPKQLALRMLAQRFVRAFGTKLTGVYHFEAMIATNMQWAEQDERFRGISCPGIYRHKKVLEKTGDKGNHNDGEEKEQGSNKTGCDLQFMPEHGYEYHHYIGDGIRDPLTGVKVNTCPHADCELVSDGFTASPIEVNQRLGGSEVSALTTSVFGVDLGIEALLIACGIERRCSFSLLPEHDDTNRLGWDLYTSPDPTPDQFDKAIQSFVASSPPPTTDLSPSLCLYIPPPTSLIRHPPKVPYSFALETAKHISQIEHFPTPTAYTVPPSPSPSPSPTPFTRPSPIPPNFHPIQPLGLSRFCASINFVPPYGGIVRALGLPKAVYHDPYYRGSIMWVNEGDKILVPPKGFDFLGFLVAAGDHPAEAQYHLRRLSDMLQWELGSE